MIASVRDDLRVLGGKILRALNSRRDQNARFFIQIAAAESRDLLSDIPVSIRRDVSPVGLGRRGRGVRLPVQRVDGQYFDIGLCRRLVHALIAHDHAGVRLSLRHLEPGARVQVGLRDAMADHIRGRQVIRQPLVLSEFHQDVVDFFASLREPEQNDRPALFVAVVQVPAERRHDVFFGNFAVGLFLRLRKRVDAHRALPVIGRIDRRILAEDSLLHIECFGKSERVPQAGDVFVVRRPHIHVDGRHHRKNIRLCTLRLFRVRLRDPQVRPAIVERPRIAGHPVHADLVDLPLIPFVELFLHALLDQCSGVFENEQLFLCFVKREPAGFTDHLRVIERPL